VDSVEELETVRTGEKWAMADPGRAGKFFDAIASFFLANIVSRREGFPEPMVLFDSPRPGLGAACGFLGEFGLFGSFCSSFCAVASKPFKILGIVSATL